MPSFSGHGKLVPPYCQLLLGNIRPHGWWTRSILRHCRAKRPSSMWEIGFSISGCRVRSGTSKSQMMVQTFDGPTFFKLTRFGRCISFGEGCARLSFSTHSRPSGSSQSNCLHLIAVAADCVLSFALWTDRWPACRIATSQRPCLARNASELIGQTLATMSVTRLGALSGEAVP